MHFPAGSVDLVWATDTDLRFTFLGSPGDLFGGCLEHSVHGLAFWDLLTLSSATAVRKVMTEVFEAFAADPSMKAWPNLVEIEVADEYGKSFWLETSLTFKKDEDGNLEGLIGIARNIDARKLEIRESCDKLSEISREKDLLEVELLGAVGRFRSILDRTGDAVVIWDNCLEPTFFNSAAEKMDEKRCLGLLDRGNRIDPAASAMRKNMIGRVLDVFETASPVEVAIHGKCCSGAVHIEGVFFPLPDSNGGTAAVASIYRDLSERALLEGELLNLKRLESLDVLAGGIAHDFNNILTSVIGNLSVINHFLKRGGPSGAGQRGDERGGQRGGQRGGGQAILSGCQCCEEHGPQSESWPDAASDDTGSQNDLDFIRARLAAAEKGAFRSRDLANQLLSFAKGGAPVWKHAVISEVIRESVDFILRGTNVSAGFDLADDLWQVEADESQLVQILNNLILNSVQAMPNGGNVFISCRNLDRGGSMTRPPGAPDLVDDCVLIEVSDDGPGIPEEISANVFKPFFTTKVNGSGLGLASVLSIVRRYSGKAWQTNRPEGGACFRILLPAARSGACPVDTEELWPVIMGTGRILVMDDDEAVREVLLEMLIDLGYEAEVTPNGDECLSRYVEALDRGFAFDAVIMDLTIPGGKGGLETVKELLRIDPMVRAIVSSGYSNDPVMANFRETGFRGVMSKPYNISLLGRVLREVLTDR